MAQHTRSELYKIYKSGFHDKAFEHLVDSSLNIKDDGIGVNKEFGLALTPKGSSKSFISFFQKISDRSSPLWKLSLGGDDRVDGFNILEEDVSRFYIQKGGKVGIGTNRPHYQLDVNGLVSSKGLVGNFSSGMCNADGQWYTLNGLRNLEGCQAFEIMAHVNDDGDRRFGLTRAVLMMSHGKRGYKNKVIALSAGSRWLFGAFANKIKLRWAPDDTVPDNEEPRYVIQIRTRTHFGMKEGQPKQIFYRVTKLWDKQYENVNFPRNWPSPDPRPAPERITRPSTTVSPQPPVTSGGAGGIKIKRKS